MFSSSEEHNTMHDTVCAYATFLFSYQIVADIIIMAPFSVNFQTMSYLHENRTGIK